MAKPVGLKETIAYMKLWLGIMAVAGISRYQLDWLVAHKYSFSVLVSVAHGFPGAMFHSRWLRGPP